MSEPDKDATARHEQSDPANNRDEPANQQDYGDSQPDYSSAYTEDSFWKKLAAFATTAGKEVIHQALVLILLLA